jgi:hypothetical protein
MNSAQGNQGALAPDPTTCPSVTDADAFFVSGNASVSAIAAQFVPAVEIH